MKNKFKKNNNILLLIFILLLVLCINLILYAIIIKNDSDEIDYYSNVNNNNTNVTESEEENNAKNSVNPKDKQLEEIKSKSEYERMQYYFAQYITYIENKDYEKAYSLLYPEFKDTYFPTLETYTEYVKKLYPKFVSFEYENFTRQGYVYILTVKIIDSVNGSKEDTKTQRIILKENNFYDYVLSFQVI